MKNDKMLCMLGLGVIVLLLCCAKSYNNVERFEEENSENTNNSFHPAHLAWILPVSIIGFFLIKFLIVEGIPNIIKRMRER